MINQNPLEVSKFDNKKINLKVQGDIQNDLLEPLKAKILEAERMIKEIALVEKRAHILVDATEFTGVYDPECFMVFAEFLKSNREYVLKTAIFGGPKNMPLIIEALAAFGDRENLKTFLTKEEAIEWINQ